MKYYSLHSYVDFAAWPEIVNNIIKSGIPTSSIQGLLLGQNCASNWFSTHFTPLLYVFALPFKLFPYCETLIALNYLLMVSSAVPLYKLALRQHKSKQFGLFMVTLLFWYPTFQYIVLYEFEMLRFSIPIILWMLYFWRRGKMILYFIFVFLAVLIREEVGLTIMMFGLYLLLIGKRRRVGLMTAFIGLGAFVIITQIVMSALSTPGNYKHIATVLFSAFGNNFGEIITNIITHPITVLTTIFQKIKLANIFMFFLPLLFIPLLAPTVLISALANFGIVMLSRSITHISYMLYYLSPSIPFIFLAFIKGWPRFLKVLERWAKKRYPLTNIDFNSVAMATVLSGVLVSNVFFGPSPISLQFWFKDIGPAPFRTQNFHYSIYLVNKHHRKVEEFVNLIPDSAIVSAEQSLMPRLYKKKGTMVFPQLESMDKKVKAEYVFIDKKNPIKTGIAGIAGSYDGLRQNPQYYYDWVEKNRENWELVKSEDGYFLYKRFK